MREIIYMATLVAVVPAMLIVGFYIVWILGKRDIRKYWEKREAEWTAERRELCNRIQAGSFTEFKAQERAETPIKRKEKDPVVARLDGEPWL